MSLSCRKDNEAIDLKELEKNVQLIDKHCLKKFLKMQLSEYEMLESMFSNPGELTAVDYSVLADFHDYLEGKTLVIPSRLNYIIYLTVGGHKLEACVNIPLEYPNLEPDVFLRSDGLNREQQRSINRDVALYISNLDRGEICICLVIGWLQENALEYFNKKASESRKIIHFPEKSESFNRFWIYSHHIYSKIKRKEILDLAHDYKITGFCLPGKPGFICIEGYATDCEEWWQKVKNMNWKKIMCKHLEKFELESSNIDKLRKFSDFREVSFESGKTKKQDFHTDFGEFYKYLMHHKCEYVFKDFFGIDGKY